MQQHSLQLWRFAGAARGSTRSLREEVAEYTEGFLSASDEDLQTEYQSIIRYVNHAATISGPEFISVVDESKGV
jgi:hypothetical protein